MQVQRRGLHRSAALENLHAQGASFDAAQQQPQGRGGRRILRRGWPKQKTQAIGPGGGELQTAQSFRTHIRHPGQQGAKRRAAQTLLDGPEPIGRTFGAHHQNARDIDAQMRPAIRIRHAGWRQQNDLATGPDQGLERLHQQADFADPAGRREQFGQAMGRPATAGQLLVELAKAARHAAGQRRVERVAAPHLAAQQRFQFR